MAFECTSSASLPPSGEKSSYDSGSSHRSSTCRGPGCFHGPSRALCLPSSEETGMLRDLPGGPSTWSIRSTALPRALLERSPGALLVGVLEHVDRARLEFALIRGVPRSADDDGLRVLADRHRQPEPTAPSSEDGGDAAGRGRGVVPGIPAVSGMASTTSQARTTWCPRASRALSPTRAR